MNILAIGAHPDDLEIYAFGTLARYTLRGDTVICATVSNGNLGHYRYTPEALRTIRYKEAENAASVIGAEYYCLDCCDLRVNASDEVTQRKAVELIRRVRPDLIITNPPVDYMPDHVETNRLVFHAAFASSIPHYPADGENFDDVVPIYYYESSGGVGFIPDEYVDITQTYKIKQKALACHESQLDWLDEHDGSNTLQEMEINALYRGLQCKARYAEGFASSRLHMRLRTYRLLP